MAPLSSTTVIPDATSRAWRAPDAALTRPSNATAYAAHKTIGSITSSVFKFTGFFRRKNAGGVLTSVKLVAAVAGIAITDMGAVRAHLYNAAPAADPGVDQSDYPMKVADVAKRIGIVDFAATWQGGGTGSDMIESYGVPIVSNMQVIASLSSLDLYMILEATAAFTPKSAAIITPYVAVGFD